MISATQSKMLAEYNICNTHANAEVIILKQKHLHENLNPNRHKSLKKVILFPTFHILKVLSAITETSLDLQISISGFAYSSSRFCWKISKLFFFQNNNNTVYL